MLNRSRCLLTVLLLSCLASTSPGDEKKADAPVARRLALQVKISGFPKAGPTNPFVLKSKKEVTETFADETTQQAILKEVDFTKEQLMYFAWSGSGQDKITADEKVNAKGEIVYRLMRGRTKDYRAHHLLFAVPAGATFTIETGAAMP